MTVGSMLKQMSQRELCHWVAFHRIENEKHDKEIEKPKESEQTKKDNALASQLLALSGKKR